MNIDWDLLYAGCWLVFVVWVVAIRLILADLDQPGPGAEAA